VYNQVWSLEASLTVQDGQLIAELNREQDQP